MAVRQPWEQQPGETGKAFAAFTTFRDQEQRPRRLIDAYRQKTGREQAEAASGAWQAWHAQHHWLDRAAAYDRHIDAARTVAVAEAAANEGREWAERRDQYNRETWDRAGRMLRKADELIRMPTTRSTGIGPKGDPVTVEPIHPASLRVAATIMREADMLARGSIADALRIGPAADSSKKEIDEIRAELDDIRRRRVAKRGDS